MLNSKLQLECPWNISRTCSFFRDVVLHDSPHLWRDITLIFSRFELQDYQDNRNRMLHHQLRRASLPPTPTPLLRIRIIAQQPGTVVDSIVLKSLAERAAECCAYLCLQIHHSLLTQLLDLEHLGAAHYTSLQVLYMELPISGHRSSLQLPFASPYWLRPSTSLTTVICAPDTLHLCSFPRRTVRSYQNLCSIDNDQESSAITPLELSIVLAALPKIQAIVVTPSYDDEIHIVSDYVRSLVVYQPYLSFDDPLLSRLHFRFLQVLELYGSHSHGDITQFLSTSCLTLKSLTLRIWNISPHDINTVVYALPSTLLSLTLHSSEDQAAVSPLGPQNNITNILKLLNANVSLVPQLRHLDIVHHSPGSAGHASHPKDIAGIRQSRANLRVSAQSKLS